MILLNFWYCPIVVLKCMHLIILLSSLMKVKWKAKHLSVIKIQLWFLIYWPKIIFHNKFKAKPFWEQICIISENAFREKKNSVFWYWMNRNAYTILFRSKSTNFRVCFISRVVSAIRSDRRDVWQVWRLNIVYDINEMTDWETFKEKCPTCQDRAEFIFD